MTTTRLLLFLFLFVSSSSSSTTLALAAASEEDDRAFIRACCNSTSYPSLCVKALSPYAGAVQEDRVQLALVAADASLPYVGSAASKSSALYKRASAAGPSSPAAKALRDCRELLGGASDDTRYSVAQIGDMKGGAGAEERRLWALSNVQTYMSAALTKEDTCVDGLREMGTAARSLRERVAKAEKYTSNALGLLNSLRTYYA